MTAKAMAALKGLRLCDLYTRACGERYRCIGESADIFAVVKGDGRVVLQANVYPFRSITRPFTGRGLQECKDFVRRWG